ncbi:hypothetical protein NEOLEDRAFT_1139463 [Neolentinus lepideus HHB14362 ss-1]|uniref:Uncharacterized protein n=1 Tax=Neolentinus lepideus HHB14362 ss-1 TaxID=1314782 RepID=A0A165PQM8_9AGAM|nr:hypothetical protein NEOLEDRAFT_1139463 [Neolentinus lepideus HHB14362 ss-1]
MYLKAISDDILHINTFKFIGILSILTGLHFSLALSRVSHFPPARLPLMIAPIDSASPSGRRTVIMKMQKERGLR